MINSISNNANNINNLNLNTNDKNRVSSKKSAQNTSVTLEISAKMTKKVTYDIPAPKKIDVNEINRLLDEVEKSTATLRALVEKLILKQKNAVEVASGKKIKSDIEIDQITQEEAVELISEDGVLGVEQTAQRIFDFAMAISGGDKSKAEELKTAIKQGFAEASKMLGGLPEISQKTYDKVMSMFEKWESEQ